MPLARDVNGTIVQAIELGTAQEVAIGAASAAVTNAFGANCRVVRVVATAACRIALGTAPVAVATGPLLPAGVVEYILAVPGWKIAAIGEAGATGKLSVTEAG